MKQRDKALINSITLTIDDEHAGQRVDNFLFNRLKQIPKSHIYKILRNGAVRANKKRITPKYRLQVGDQLRLPPLMIETATTVNNQPSKKAIALLEKRILFEDDNLLIINKPAGMASHGGSGISFGVIETMRFARPKLNSLELVHRLDRDTSGCLVLAKKRKILKELHEIIRCGKMVKKYLLLVRGVFKDHQRVVTLSLAKNRLQSGERVVKVDDTGKTSRTIFRIKQIFHNATLLEAELETGRTHQIRVHALHIGHPIAGDEKYGDREFNRYLKGFGLKRLFLHAAAVSFKLAGGQKIQISSKLDGDLQALLEQQI